MDTQLPLTPSLVYVQTLTPVNVVLGSNFIFFHVLNKRNMGFVIVVTSRNGDCFNSVKQSWVKMSFMFYKQAKQTW